MAEYYSTPGTSAVDIPKYYANWDEEFWVVAPTPDRTYEITLAYDKEPPTITDTTDTAGTYLSNKYSDLTFICLPSKCIWVLERTAGYVTILSKPI